MKTKNMRIGMLITALFISCLVGSPNATATTTPATLDQSTPILSADQIHAVNIADWQMQEFTPSESGVLTRLDLALGRESNRVNSFHVDIFPIDSEGQPVSSPVFGNPEDLEPVQILATSVFEGSPSSPDYQWTTINLERPVVLVGGQSYLIRPVPEDGDGNITWYTSSSEYSRGGALYDDGGVIYLDDSETSRLQYGFKTWMTPSVFGQSGVWQAGSIEGPNEIDCVDSSGYCPEFNNLSTNANGSRVFGVTDSVTYTIHSSDIGLSYSTLNTSHPIRNGGLHGTAMYSNANGEGVLLARNCNLWNSVDGGVTFSRITAVDFGPGDNACFKQVVATQNGQVMAAVASGFTFADRHQGVYVSVDAGVTWTETIFDQSWTSIALSGNGSKMIMASDDGFVKFSSDFGVTWNSVVIGLNNTGRFNSVAMTSDGGTAFLSDNHRLFRLNTSDSAVSTFGHEDLWTKIQVSSDGMIIAALDDSGSIFVSCDSDHTLAQAGDGSISFSDTALSSNGLLLHASSAGKMHRIVPSTVGPNPIISDPSSGPSASPEPSVSTTTLPPPVNSVASVVTTEVSTKTAKFSAGSSALTVAGKKAIKKIVSNSGKDARYTVTAVASKSLGIPNSNVKALAKARAVKVKAYLIKLGVKKSQITIKIKIADAGVIPKTKIMAKYLSK